MRGKLRDKRATNKHDIFKRELIERRRPNKHTNRIATRKEQIEDDDYEEMEPEETEEATSTSSKK